MQTYDCYNKNADNYYQSLSSQVTAPNYFVASSIYRHSRKESVAVGYFEMEENAIELTEFSIAYKRFSVNEQVNIDTVDLAVFWII